MSLFSRSQNLAGGLVRFFFKNLDAGKNNFIFLLELAPKDKIIFLPKKVMKKRFLNVHYLGQPARIDTKDMEDLSQIQEKVLVAFEEITVGYSKIQLYDKDHTFIKTWSQFCALPEEYFQEESGLLLTIQLRPSPTSSRQPSDANLLATTGTMLVFYIGVQKSIDSTTISSKRKFKVELEGLVEEESQIVIPDIPMAYPYTEKIFFTRSCYKKLCVSILKHFKEVTFPIITVTGTPGIGKSMFMQHFFKVLLEEEGYKDRVIVLASFHNQVLRSALKYQSGEYVYLNSMEFEMSDRNYVNSIHIYDGSPPCVPNNCPMITFSSPNVKWFKLLTKINTNKKFFMETWTLIELQKAVEKLNLSINADDLKKSYHLFGGVARYCLSPSPEFRNGGECELTAALSKITQERLRALALELKSCLDKALFSPAIEMASEEIKRLYSVLYNVTYSFHGMECHLSKAFLTEIIAAAEGSMIDFFENLQQEIH